MPGGSQFLFPSNLQTLPKTMKAVSKGHLAKSSCWEDDPAFVQMSLAEQQKHNCPIPKTTSNCPSRNGEIFSLSRNHGALCWMYGNFQARTWFRGVWDVQHLCFLFLVAAYLLVHHKVLGKQPRAHSRGDSKWGGRGKTVKGNTSVFIKIRTIVPQSYDKNYFLLTN